MFLFGLLLAVNATNTPLVVLGPFPHTNTNNKTVSATFCCNFQRNSGQNGVVVNHDCNFSTT